jgi:hypothetical protein
MAALIATDVHAACDRRRCRRQPEPGYGLGEVVTQHRKDPTAMTPIAAYYVMVVTDHEREMRRPRYESIVARPSLATRIVGALEILVRLGRPATTQPI